MSNRLGPFADLADNGDEALAHHYRCAPVTSSGPRTIHVVPVTTNVKRSLPTEIPIQAAGLERPSAAQCHLCTVISTERIANADQGNIGSTSLAQECALLADLLDIP